MGAGRACLAGMVRRNGQQHAAVPNYLIRQLASELAPAMVENCAVQARFLFHHLAVLFAVAFGRAGHVAYLQIQNAYERVVLADRRCGFVQEVFTGIGDAGVNLLDAGLRLLPVVAELDLMAHTSLVTGQALLMFLEAVERRDIAFVAPGGKPGNADIDTDGRCRGGQRLFDFALRLNRREPLAARLTHGDIAQVAENVPAVAIT